jgi:cytochrome P450
MPALEGKEHHLVRSAAAGWFSGRRVTQLNDQIEATVDVLLDELEIALRRGPVDLQHQFCRQLPAVVIGMLYGMSHDQVRDLGYLRQFDAALTVLDVNLSWYQYKTNAAALQRLFGFVEDQLRRGPANGLPQHLANNQKLTQDQRIVNLAIMFEAGFATTVQLLANAIRLLLDHPDELQILREEPHRWRNAIDEVLRIEAPLRYTTRIAVCGTSLAGQTIRRGQMIVLDLAGAGLDPDVFPFPFNFDVLRHNAYRHYAFSAGRHYCIGPTLARNEALIALPRVFERFPTLKLATQPVRAKTQIMQQWSDLWVTL